MIIELTNFRCWKTKTFTLPDKGVILLHGMSGAGKTTILQAIYFALFGSLQKVVSHDEKKCKVRLLYKEFDICRTKGPSVLKVTVNGVTDASQKEHYQDDVAQEFINAKFGKHFSLTSYITQKSTTNFFFLSPTEKMLFLEELSLCNDNNIIKNIKLEIKGIIKEKKNLLQQKTGQISLIDIECTKKTQILKTFKCVEFPLPGVYSAIKIKNSKTKLLNSSKKTTNASNKLQVVQRKLDDLQEQQQLIACNNIKIQNLTCTIDNNVLLLKDCNHDINYELQLRLYLKNIEDHKTYESTKLKLNKMNKEISEMKILETEKFNAAHDDIKSSCLILSTKLKSYTFTEDIFKIKTNISNIKQRNVLKALIEKSYISCNCSSMEELESLLTLTNARVVAAQCAIHEEIESTKIKYCPHCENSVKIINNQLVKCSDIIIVNPSTNNNEVLKTNQDLYKKLTLCKSSVLLNSQEYDTIEISMVSLEALTSSLQSAEASNMNYTKINNLLTIETQKLNVKFDKFSPSLEKIIKEYKSQRLLPNIPVVLSTKLSSTDILKELVMQENNKLLKVKLNNKNIELQKELNVLLNLGTSNQINIEESISSLQDDKIAYMKTINDELLIHKKLKLENKLVDDYMEYKTVLDDANEYTNKLHGLKCEESNICKELETSELFSKKVLEAEAQTVLKTIDSINYKLNEYLERFFPDDPIAIDIVPYKITKKSSNEGGALKPGIDIIVTYKNIVCDFSSLSGGQVDRVILALVLGLNDLYSNDILLLDECIASIDAQLTQDIVLFLKENFSDKLILLVAHQVVTGLFDGVINVK